MEERLGKLFSQPPTGRGLDERKVPSEGNFRMQSQLKSVKTQGWTTPRVRLSYYFQNVIFGYR